MFNRNQPSKKSKLSNEVITTVIGEDMIINGSLNSNTSIRIDGQVNGNITAQKLIIVGEKAKIIGDLKAQSIILFGELEGDIFSSDTQIKKTGIVTGNITTEIIEIEKEGKYNGNLMMKPKNQTPKNTKEIKLKEVKN